MAQTLKFGNKTWATKVGSTLAYNDENGNYKPLPFAFTRSTSATRVNKEGLIEVVTNDRPRIDYTDTSDGVLLLEKAATNLIQYSEAFDNSYWTKSGSSVVSGFTSPDGTANAFKLMEDTSTGAHYISILPTINSGEYTQSIYVKASNRNFIVLRNNSLYGSPFNCAFDLSRGINTFNGMTGSAKIESLTNNWYKISVVNQSSSNGTARYFRVYLSDVDVTTNAEPTYIGDGTSGVEIFGAMLEQNSVVSSYIPTQGSASTRVAETASGSGNSEVFNDSEGVLFADISALANDGNGQIRLMEQGVLNSVIMEFRNSGTTLRTYIFDGNATNQFLSETNINPNDNIKIALKYKQNDCSLYLNGFVTATDTNATMPSNLNTLSFNQGDGSNHFYGSTKEIGYYNTILTDLELETLTSYKSWTSMVNELNLNIIYNG